MLRPCLLNSYETSILTPLRKGATDSELKAIIHGVIQKKPASHDLAKNNPFRIASQMSSIGG